MSANNHNNSNENSEDSLNLGGNIQLSGFRALDGASMIIIKKMVGSFANKIAEKCKKFQNLRIHLKKLHQTEGSEGINHVAVTSNMQFFS